MLIGAGGSEICVQPPDQMATFEQGVQPARLSLHGSLRQADQWAA